MTMTNRDAHLAPENLRAAVAVLDDILPARAQAERKDFAKVTEPVTA